MLKASQNHDLMINDRYMRSFTFLSIDFIIKLKQNQVIYESPRKSIVAILKASQKPWYD